MPLAASSAMLSRRTQVSRLAICGKANKSEDNQVG